MNSKIWEKKKYIYNQSFFKTKTSQKKKKRQKRKPTSYKGYMKPRRKKSYFCCLIK